MKDIVFRRKIYDEILEWKEKYSHKYALLIKGARRVGKSTIAEEFTVWRCRATYHQSR